MANLAQFNSYTAANLRSQAPNSINLLFNELLKRGSGATGDVLAKFEGPDGQMGFPITRITDFSKSAGELVQFTKHGGLGGPPVLGDNVAQGLEEKMRFGTHSVRIDFIRKPTAYTRKQLRLMAAGKNVPAAIAKELDRYIGQLRTQFIMQRWLQRAVAGHNIFYPNNRGSIGQLTSTDLMSTTVIERSAAMLTQNGASPIANAKMPSGAVVPQYLYFAPNDVLQSLYADTLYTNRRLYSEQRGTTNSFTEGGFVDWNGNQVFHWNVVNDDSNNVIGSFFNPKAKNGTAIAAGTAALVLTGGGAGYTSTPDYFRHFSGNITSFLQYDGEVLAADTNDYFVYIWNHVASAAGGDQGKWGFYRYVGSTGNIGTTITTASYSATTGRKGGRLSATANGGGADTRDTTVGSVAWNAAINAEDHPVGAPMYLANKLGNIIGYIGALGTESALIGYGGGAMGDPGASFAGRTNYQGKSSTAVQGAMQFSDSQDYGMQIAAIIEAVMGVDVSLNTAGLPPNYVLIPVAYKPPEIS